MVSQDGTFVVVFSEYNMPQKIKNPYGASVRVAWGAPHLRHEGATCNKFSCMHFGISLVKFIYLNPSFVWCTLKLLNLAL